MTKKYAIKVVTLTVGHPVVTTTNNEQWMPGICPHTKRGHRVGGSYGRKRELYIRLRCRAAKWEAAVAATGRVKGEEREGKRGRKKNLFHFEWVGLRGRRGEGKKERDISKQMTSFQASRYCDVSAIRKHVKYFLMNDNVIILELLRMIGE